MWEGNVSEAHKMNAMIRLPESVFDLGSINTVHLQKTASNSNKLRKSQE